jgi:xanthosine phosphorylase
MTTKNIAPSQQAAALIRERAPGLKPRVALILGSGLGALAQKIEDAVTIPYAELPGFPRSTVVGHAGELVLGRLNGVAVMCMRGRAHFYEGHGMGVMTQAVRTMKLMGCEVLFATCAAGSVHADVGPGRLVALKDHINMMPGNPLTGPNDDEVGPRFPSLGNAYDQDLRQLLKEVAVDNGLRWAEGVYVAYAGPNFETPAEIKMFKTLGGDVVGQSIVPEVISARHCGLKVVAVATITNLAEGLTEVPLSHEQTLQFANLAATDLATLVMGWLQAYRASALAAA